MNTKQKVKKLLVALAKEKYDGVMNPREAVMIIDSYVERIEEVYEIVALINKVDRIADKVDKIYDILWKTEEENRARSREVIRSFAADKRIFEKSEEADTQSS